MKLILTILLSAFLSIPASAKSSKKPASDGAIQKIQNGPFASFYGNYLISSCKNSGQLLMDHCDYKYLIVSKANAISPAGVPVPAVKFRYMSRLNAGSFLDNSLAILQNQKDTTYLEEKDSSEYRQSFKDSSGHTKSTEIHFIKNADGSYQLNNKSEDAPAEGDSYMGETILSLKKL